MFADLDDTTPPSADATTRKRVDARTAAVQARSRRDRRLTRVGLIVAVAVFAVVVGLVAAVGRSSRHEPTVPAAATPTGDVIDTWSFVGHPSAADQQTTVDRLNQRFSAVGQPTTAWLQDGHVVVTAPTAVDWSASSELNLTETGRLEFRPVIEEIPPFGSPVTPTTTPGSTGQIVLPAGSPGPNSLGPPPTRWVLGPAFLDGAGIAVVTAANSQGRWELRPVLRPGPDGIDRFNAMATQCFEMAPTCPSAIPSGIGTGQIAIVLDGQVLVAPTILVSSYQRDQITISGAFTQARAMAIAAMITSGELPAPLDLPAR